MHQPSEALFSSKVDYCLFVYKTPQAVGTILETAFVGHTVLPLQNVFSLELYRNIYGHTVYRFKQARDYGVS